MLKKDNVFHWEEQQTQSFQQIKTLIAKANNTPLRYYDRNLPVTVQVDALLRGLGACLIQKHNGEDQPIAFASKSLMDAEIRYANRDKVCQHATGDDCHEEPCECATTSSEDAAGAREI